jgi:hypothetical protein
VGVAGADAADDVDGAGGVDHRRVLASRSPRRAGRAASPRHPCGKRARHRPVAPAATAHTQPPAPPTRATPKAGGTNHKRAGACRAASRAIEYRRAPPCHPTVDTAPDAHTHRRATHTHTDTHTWKHKCARVCACACVTRARV